MAASIIPLLYSSDHFLHTPVSEFDQGHLIEYRENPERIEGIFHHLTSRRLGWRIQPVQPATTSDLCSIHSLEMLDFLEACSNSINDDSSYIYADFFSIRSSMNKRPKSLGGCMGIYATDPYSPIGKGTWKAILSAAGLALQGAEMILNHQTTCAYALCRPPGHHAGPDFFGSYCYTNHAALAANRLAVSGRVAILDIDYHHGNGTQAVFWDDPRVLYASLHIDPNLDFPYLNGYSNETGGSQAPGSTINIPLSMGTNSLNYIQALNVLLQAIHAFQPAALVVSVGFDPYQNDPLSAFRVEAGAYTTIGSEIGMLRLPVLFVQEGGYAVHELPILAENLISGYLGCQI